ncbi:MAG: hypothetical protein GXW85_04420, partial [Clostridia bacterium]|nr:hypothetical protein [Clostridia bacterium]
MKSQNSTVRILNILSILVLSIVFIIALYIMNNDLGLIEGLNFGPGQYYYTDIPGYEKIFFGPNTINIGTDHPFFFFGAFFLWVFICFKFLAWM